MRILNFYITKSLVSSTVIAILIVTFVLFTGNMIKAFDLLARGFPPSLLFRFLFYLMPRIFQLALPIAVLCATVIVFSRMSADNEIMAMRAAGISIWQIISPGLLFSALIAAMCLMLHTVISPDLRHKAATLQYTETATNPLGFLEPGRFVELPGHIIYVGGRKDNELKDIHIYSLGADGKVAQDITARSGSVKVFQENRSLELHLKNATIVTADLFSAEDKSQIQRLSGQDCVLPMDYGESIDGKPLQRKIKHMNIWMLFSHIRIRTKQGIQATPLYVELHKRLSLALSPLAFFLIGVPFGIRTRRTETSVGIVLSSLLAMFFYLFVILADALEHNAAFRPEVIVWLPNILYQAGGLWALVRISKR